MGPVVMPCRRRLPILGLLLALTTSAPAQNPRKRVPLEHSPVFAMKEYHERPAEFAAALELVGGERLVSFGATTTNYLEALVKAVGEEGSVVAVFRSMENYRFQREEADPVLRAAVDPIFAADGDAHLEPDQADVVIAFDLWGFYQREDDLYRQAAEILKVGGRLFQVRTALRNRQDQEARWGDSVDSLDHKAQRFDFNRQKLAVERFGFQLIKEVPVYRSRTLRVFRKIAAP